MAQKRKARARDDRTCQHCGAPGSDVHHIRPFRFFTDYREANELTNLITLCKPCHRRADAAIQAVA
jgi:5-methylcytosine-specific restriction endonuclease McrA